jgi:hypothetical protein
MDISYLQLHYYALTFTLYLNIYSLKVKICANNVIWINNLALKNQIMSFLTNHFKSLLYTMRMNIENPK